MASALLPLGLAFLMFVVGMRLTLAGLADIFRHPVALFAGLSVQMVLLPVVAAVLAALFAMPAEMAAGLLVIAAAPGGITSNYVALVSRADVALSTAMTLVTSLLACLTIPLVLMAAGLSLGEGSPVAAMLRMSVAMFSVTGAPLAIGMALRRFLPAVAVRLDRPLDLASRLVFAAIVLSTFWQNREAMIAYALDVGPPAALLNVTAIAAGLGVARLLGLPRRQGYAIAIEAGLQNAAMAMFVAATIFGQPALAVPALVYAVIMNVSALGLIAMARSRAPLADPA